jgi:hypothetical protein
MSQLISKKRGGRDPERFGAALANYQERQAEKELADEKKFLVPLRVGKIDSYDAVIRYLRRTLRRVESGTISANDAVRRSQVAATILQAIEKKKLVEVEKRLAELEAKAGAK